MIWPEDDDGDDAAADFRALQRKQEEYARELDRQIAARRAAQEQEQQAREELERKLRPGARSPAKWLVEGGHVDYDPWASADIHSQQQQQQVHGAETGEPMTATAAAGASSLSAASPFTRFRVTDESQASERLRERAQQLEWRRVLDEQVRENARLRAAQEEERRRGEREAAEEEMRFLRDQQLRAQRKLGYVSPSPAPTASRLQYRPIPSPQHNEPDSVADANAALQASVRRRFQINDGEQAETSTYPTGNPYGGVAGGGSASMLPPAAPTRLHGKSSFASPNDGSSNARNGANGATNSAYVATGNEDTGSSYEYQQHSRLDIIEQYRGLLNEIRREREELRREREEVRREKEELRIQRALLELENEKMASLVDAQRRLTEHQMERQQRDAHAFAQQQHQQQMEMALQMADVLPGDDGAPLTPARREPTPPRFGEYSRADHLRQSLAALNIADPGRPATPHRRASPMSMAEFAAPRNRQTPYVADSPVYQQRQAATPYQRSQAAWVDELAEHETPLDQSLVGESVFVPVEPAATQIAATTSPRGQHADPRSPLRNSRVIRSRGFYDIEKAYEAPAPSRARATRYQRLDMFSNDQEEQKYGRDEQDYSQEDGELEDYADEEAESSFDVGQADAEIERFRFGGDGSWASISDFGEDEQREFDAGASKGRGQGIERASGAGFHEEEGSGRSSAASGLFQVQVLV